MEEKIKMKANLRVITVLACAVLVGSCFAQGQGGRQRGGGNSLRALLRRADVQAELKITDDEKAKIEALPQPQRGQGGGGGGAGAAGGPPDPAAMAAAMAARAAEEKKAIEAILTPEQMKRLGELVIQREGARAISRAEVQTDLGLSDDQKAKIKSLNDKFQEASRDLRAKVRSGDMEQQAMREATATNTKVLMDELTKVLTSEQADKLKAMGGTPFTFAAGNGGL
jgi:hypothetical protein